MHSGVPRDPASNSGCLASFSHSHSSSQVAPLGGTPEGDICGGRFGSQVDICRAGTACLCGGGNCLWAWASLCFAADVHYSGEKLLTQLFSIKNNLSIHALSQELLIQAFSRFRNCSPFYMCILKWTKFFANHQAGTSTP